LRPITFRRPLTVLAAAALASACLAGSAAAVDRSQPELNRGGDQRADQAVLRAAPNGDLQWFWKIAGRSTHVTETWGNARLGDIPITGDFDGDGHNDATVYRPGRPSRWFILGTASGPRSVAFGEAGDVPLHGDFDGDRKADIAVARPAAGGVGPWTWFIAGSTGRFGQLAWGETSTDTAIPANYVGDGRTDVAVRRFEANGTTAWYIRQDDGRLTRVAWGEADDLAVTGDYDGDGRTDIAVVRTVSGIYRWFLRGSTGQHSVVDWGEPYNPYGFWDHPTWSDADGDGRTDVGVWRAFAGSTPARFIVRTAYSWSPTPTSSVYEWGASGTDRPLQAHHLDLINGVHDPAVP
jgi:hypothetical protein